MLMLMEDLAGKKMEMEQTEQQKILDETQVERTLAAAQDLVRPPSLTRSCDADHGSLHVRALGRPLESTRTRTSTHRRRSRSTTSRARRCTSYPVRASLSS